MSYLISSMNFRGAEMQMQHCLLCQTATVSHTELLNLIQPGSPVAVCLQNMYSEVKLSVL